jgi:glutamyl-tRNA reductase
VAGVREAAILSTCNRAEIYVVGDENAGPGLENFLDEFHHVPARALENCLYRGHDAQSARHLFRVASGVESLVLGESEILGQIKTAFETARQSGTSSQVLDELFRRAIACGKRARTETAIGRGALSVGSAAVELARQIFGPLTGHTVFILGAGKMSARTAKTLVSSGARRVLVANRTFDKAQELAAQFGPDASAIRWDEFPARLAEADIVIASTRAPGHIVRAEHVAQAMRVRRHRPLFLVDIAVPRDIDPQAHQLDNVFVYDIDDLQGVVNANLAQRTLELPLVESIIEDEVASWQKWYRARAAQPVMAALARRAGQIRESEVQNALSQLGHLSERDREIVKALAKSVEAKIMHAPLRHLREAGENGSPDVDALRRAFGLEEEPREEAP